MENAFYLILIWVGFLGARFEVVGGKITPSKTRLETWNVVREFTHICSFRKYTFQYRDPLNFADVSIFLQKIRIFWLKWYLYSKQ